MSLTRVPDGVHKVRPERRTDSSSEKAQEGQKKPALQKQRTTLRMEKELQLLQEHLGELGHLDSARRGMLESELQQMSDAIKEKANDAGRGSTVVRPSTRPENPAILLARAASQGGAGDDLPRP